MDIKNEVERQYNILKHGCEEIINEVEYNESFENKSYAKITLIKYLSENILKSGKKGFIFFNNTWGNAAVKNAIQLKKYLSK